MPSFRQLPRFRRDFEQLSSEQKAAFRVAVGKFVEDLGQGRFRPGLRVRALQATAGIFEMTWTPNGRATFEYGDAVHRGETHIVWRRCGTHRIFEAP